MRAKHKINVRKKEVMYYQCNTEAHSRNHICRGISLSITDNECARVRARAWVCMCVSLIVRHAKRMRRFILSSVACLAVPYFFHIITQTARFSEKSY
jgi:hypothetical protein